MVSINGSEIKIRRVWRSQLKRLAVFFLLCIMSIVVSRLFPHSLITGHLITIGPMKLYLTLPLFSLAPLIAFFNAMLPIYDGFLRIDSRGVELRLGILSLHQKITRVRYEDIRGIEVDQSILERILDVGTIEIGSAATDDMEIVFDGVGAPREVQELIQAERDKRLRFANKNTFNQIALAE